MHFQCCSAKQQQIWLFVVGGIFVILGIVLIAAWPTLSEKIVNSKLPLSPGSILFSKWVVTPMPLYFNFYMFNWTNPQQANDSTVKPNFEEFGPYVFREIRVKEDLKWSNDKSLITYFNRRTWYFDASKSNGTLEDMITAPHLPTVTAAKMSMPLHSILRKIINFTLNRESGRLAMTRSVRNWLFEGFYDDFMDFLTRLHSPLLRVEDEQFAYFYKRNGSKEAEGRFTINTGKTNLRHMGDMKYWRNLNNTGYWEGECGHINGSTGEVWTPNMKWHDPVSIFFADTYRFLNIFPQSNEHYRGIEAILYKSTELTFDNGYKAEDTKCFCVKGRECPKIGVIDLSPPYSGAPVYMSHPHFNMADSFYRENTTGLKPDPEKHIIYVLLEPRLGIPLEIDGRVLISTFVERNQDMDLLRDLAWNFYAPLFYIQVQTTISDDILRMVKLVLNLPQIGQYIGIALAITGMIIIAVGIIMAKNRRVTNNVKEETNK